MNCADCEHCSVYSKDEYGNQWRCLQWPQEIRINPVTGKQRPSYRRCREINVENYCPLFEQAGQRKMDLTKGAKE